jgi:hypothetical protein
MEEEASDGKEAYPRRQEKIAAMLMGLAGDDGDDEVQVQTVSANHVGVETVTMNQSRDVGVLAGSEVIGGWCWVGSELKEGGVEFVRGSSTDASGSRVDQGERDCRGTTDGATEVIGRGWRVLPRADSVGGRCAE